MVRVNQMRVLRIELDGTVTSFRYPHIHLGRQPSYPMPPPATIYGHVCSALGEWIERSSARFAYSFTCAGTGDDLELIYMTSVGSGRLDKAWGYTKNIEAQTNVLPRQVLLHPRLTLYLDAGKRTEEWLEAFRSPTFPVLLGRSQDLAAYRSVEIIQTEEREFGYFESTLLPWSLRDRLSDGITVQMPKFIDPAARHNVVWDRYVVLDRRLWWPSSEALPPKGARQAMRKEGDASVWVDPMSPLWGPGRRIISWHSWE
jgi:CRISPR-associated protein Cas5t